MPLLVLDHPLVVHRITVLRDKATSSAVFRRTVTELSALLAYEATRHLRVERTRVHTPTGFDVDGARLPAPGPLLVPILRAGLGLLDGFLSVLPEAEVGMIGLRRDEETFEPEQYALKVPDRLDGRDVFVLDPMLATGGSLAHTCGLLASRGAASITAVAVIAAPEGVRRVEHDCPGALVVTAALDHGLNEHAYIVPGLGDAGDRLFGRSTAS